jgi:hypothetical protein
MMKVAFHCLRVPLSRSILSTIRVRRHLSRQLQTRMWASSSVPLPTFLLLKRRSRSARIYEPRPRDDSSTFAFLLLL